LKITPKQKIDRELVLAASGGDRESIRTVLKAIMPRVRSSVHYMIRNDADAEDQTQICLLEIIRSLHSYRGEASFERWVDTLVMRTVFHWIRKRKVHVTLEREPADLSEKPNGDPARWSEKMLLRRKVAVLLESLNPDKRSTLVMKLVHGYSVEEIARTAGVSVNTIKKRLRTARAKLKKMVREDSELMEILQ